MEIRQVNVNEVNLIRDFLDNHWKKGHSLVKSRSLLDFQHLDNDIEKYNFYVAIDDKNEVWSLQGFIPTTIYDCSLTKGDSWGAIWKTREDAPDTLLGVELLDRICKEQAFISIGAIGISGVAKKIYKLLKWKVGYLHQYFIANETINNYTILSGLVPPKKTHHVNTNWSIKVLYSLQGIEDSLISYYPQKSIKYFINRYEKHPIYRYFFWCIYEQNTLKSVWAIRRVIVNNTSIFRIVDIYGRIDDFVDLYVHIQNILRKESVEYVDILNYGIEEALLKKIGFSYVNYDLNDIICPNYFEPFEQSNVKIELAYKTSLQEYVCFKGDADQDRPNII